MIAHHNVIAQSMQVEQITSKENKKVLAVLPLFHSQRIPTFEFANVRL